MNKNGNMYKAIIFGATGAVGKKCLKELIKCKLCENILVISRRTPKGNDNSKVKVVVWKDFHKYLIDPQKQDSIQSTQLFSGYDVLFNCLGTTRKQSPTKQMYIDITQNFGIEIGKICKNAKVPYHYIISSSGANHKSMFSYMKMKGKTDHELQKMGFVGLGIIRPGFLVAKRNGRIIESCMNYISPLISGAFPSFSIPVETVAAAMVEHFRVNWSKRKEFEDIIETVDLKKISESM